jgi:hypothetical protein
LPGCARPHASLTEIDRSPSMCEPEWCPDDIEPPPDRWTVFLVDESELVAPLTHEPVVLTGVGTGHTCDSVPIEEDPRGRECKGWLDPAVEWYVDESLWDVTLAESGPSEWERIAVDDWLDEHDAPRTPLDDVEVFDISSDDDEISFRVDQTGVPVLVRASYFPNWKVEGADGPYRVTPNLMVVVPTEREIRLHYGYVGIDVIAWGCTFVGLGLLVVLAKRGPLLIPPGPVAEWRRPRPADEPLGEPESADGGLASEPPVDSDDVIPEDSEEVVIRDG